MLWKLLLILLFIFTCSAYSQVITWTPPAPTADDSIVVIFDASKGTAGLKGYTGDVYAHTGVITDNSTSGSDWRYVIAEWSVNLPKAKLTRIGTDLYRFVIKPDPVTFYGVPSNEKIKQVAFVFRNPDGTREGKDTGGSDIFMPVYETGLVIHTISPSIQPYFVNKNDTIDIKIASYFASQGTGNESSITLSLYKDNDLIYQSDEDTISYRFINTDSFGKVRSIKIVAEDTSGITKVDSISYFPSPQLVIEELPQNVRNGINYTSNTSVTLVLYAPFKRNTYVIGDFNNWTLDSSYFMKQTPDGLQYWITIDNLTPQQEYAYQYYVNGEVKIADPYTEKILDPANDQYIPASVYPDLKPYPAGKTENVVSVLQTGQTEYQWQAADFERPEKSDLVIYELLVRDFISTHSYKTLKDTLSYLKNLGVNAIELMPVYEFEGNESWGYNSSFHFAPDKYYGTENDLKAFIDECHKNGIAVIIDMVLNHLFGQSSLVRLYWDENKPAANSPWFNQVAKHDFNVGFDFNHESPATREYSKRVMEFWLEEYNIDGYRFDLSKGFTQKNTLGNTGAWGQLDQTRIDIWEDYSNHIRGIDSSAYIILEHFADNNEEQVLSSMGMMLWGNMNYNYGEAAMGWHEDRKSDFSRISYKARNWQYPYLVGYMESHDEERMMFRNIQYGRVSGNYNIKDTSQALNRIKLAAAFFFTIPGPKMIWQFGELGYDYSIDYNGRLGNKPIRWDYFNDPRRNKLYKVFQALIKLRKENEAFKSSNYSIFLSSSLKRIHINHPTMNVTIIGNFDVTQQNIIPSFQSTGTWYDYFSGDSINVTNTQELIALQPGEFHIYTTKRLPVPEADILTDVEEITGVEVKDFRLEQNYPNPFNPVTVISYTIGTSQLSSVRTRHGVFVQIKVYDLLGREVATLVNKEQDPGRYEVKFDASSLSSGVYLYRLKAGDFVSVKKMMVVR